MSVQGVVLACGGERRFGDLVTQDRPRHMLDLGFNPIVWHALQTLEHGGVKDVRLVARGDHAASRFEAWLREGYDGGCDVQVVAAADDADTADALRAAMPTVSPDAQVLAVVSGDLVTDVRLSDVLATHVRGGAVATCLLAKRRAWNGVDMKVGRPPKGAHYVGLANDRLLLMADEEDVDKVLKLRRPMLRRARDLVVHTDLLDAQLYVLDRAKVRALLDAKPHMTSLQLDVIPALVRRQFRDFVPGGSAEEPSKTSETSGDAGLMEAVFGVANQGGNQGETHRPPNLSVTDQTLGGPCCAHLAPDDAYCARVDTVRLFFIFFIFAWAICLTSCYQPKPQVVPALLEVSREVASSQPGDAAHLNGRKMSKYENFVDPSVVIGGKSTIGPGCIVGVGTSFGEKCSVKRSVVGAGCSVGDGVKLVNCVVMNRATIEDGATVQGSVVGPRAVIGAGASLRECLVEAEFEVEEGDDVRSETLQNKSR